MSIDAKTIPTPNPKYRALFVDVSDDSFASNGGVIPVQGTQYKNFPASLVSKDYIKRFGDFVYVQQGEQTKDGGSLIFAPNLTPDEANTPFRTKSWFGNHRWPPVLKALKLITARDFPLVTQSTANNATVNNYATRYLVRQSYIPEATEGTRFVQEEFISPTKFDIPQYQVPTTSSITFHYLNFNIGFPECLHKKFELSDLISTTAIYSGGITTENYNQIKGQVFYATNFTQWAPYVLSDDQDIVGGVWYRKRVRVYPPPPPKVITRIQAT